MKKGRKLALVTSIIVCVVVGVSIISLIISYSRKEQLNLKRISEYLYSMEVEDYSYEMISKIMENYSIKGVCTSFRKGNLVGRNMDWLYDNSVEFVVRTSATDSRYASIGVASLSEIDKSILENDRYAVMLDFMPFYVVDGINECGLVVNANMVPSMDLTENTNYTNPGGYKISSAILTRYLLDYAKDCDEAIRLVQEADIYALISDGEPFEVHLMVSDKNRTIVIEFINNEVVITENQNILTNFFIGNVDENGVVVYTDHAQGIERYEIIEDLYPTLEVDKGSFFNALKKVYFSHYYDENYKWYSDTYGDLMDDGVTYYSITTPTDVLDSHMLEEQKEFKAKNRDGEYELWITCHTCVYDIDELKMYIVSQEGDSVYSFSLND